ncbi:MAG: DUF6265 family protein [Salibacteraceae bacterium]
MKKSLGLLITGLTFLLLSSCEHKPDINQYNWLLGSWEFPGEDTLTFEIWKPVSDTLYEGFNFQVHESDTIMKEHLWLEVRDQKIIFSAKVFGHNEDRRIFFDIALKNMKVARFENHGHDFPTVIEYHKTGKNYLEVKLKNESTVLPPIVMQRINEDGTFAQ